MPVHLGSLINSACFSAANIRQRWHGFQLVSPLVKAQTSEFFLRESLCVIDARSLIPYCANGIGAKSHHREGNWITLVLFGSRCHENKKRC
jgi:hypothetical protein